MDGISKNIEVTRRYMEKYFCKCFDLIEREILLFGREDIKAFVVYLEGLCTKEIIEEQVISRLSAHDDDFEVPQGINESEFFRESLGVDVDFVHDTMKKSVDAVLSGNPVIFISGLKVSFEMNLSSPPKRDISEPPIEVISKGPREGFTESFMTNVNLIRKRIKNCSLKMEKLNIGEKTRTNVVMVYLDGEADKRTVASLGKKLRSLKMDSVLDSNYISEYLQNDDRTIYPKIFKTEKPDVACAKLLEGRVVVIVDGSPVALSLPGLFVEFLQSSEDYYIKYSSATLNRYVRYVSLLITVQLPAMYVSLTTFHQELIPSKLLLSFIGARTNVPLPEFWETLFMLLAFEIMREAGLRVSKTLGTTISVIGALILGDAAVSSGIVGTPTVVVVSLTAMTKFTIPGFEMDHPIIYARLFLLILSGCFGLIGLTCGTLMILIRLVSMRTFGVPYMFPICPFNINSMQDVAVRAPMTRLKYTQKTLGIKGKKGIF